MSKARLAPALQVFQTLQRYPIIRPRRQPDVPIGCVSPSMSAQTAQKSILSLYHDLGVLVFAGCSVAQTERIGDILRQLMTWGGPGGAITRLTTGQHTHKRMDELSGQDLHDTLDEARPGQIKPDAILKMASSRFRQLLQKQIDAVPDLDKVSFQEMQVIIPGTPAPSGTILPAETGPRNLKLDSYATVGIDRDSGHAVGEILFFAVGTGDYVGAARIDYRLVQVDRGKVVPLWGHGRLDKRRALSTQGQRERLAEVTGLLGKLWELEREVWAHRAEGLE